MPLELGLAVLTAASAAAVYWTIRRRRRIPGDPERNRRLAIHRDGRMVNGIIHDVTDDTLYFSYSFRGMEYHASQDVSSLKASLPLDAGRVVGPVTVKLLPENPSNSIVLCESWSGLRKLMSN